MLSFIVQNLSTIIVSAIILGLVVMVALKLIAGRKNGDCHCKGECSGCGCSCAIIDMGQASELGEIKIKKLST
ncbi:MAG: FeoB-associated Cys-rich membrane protein [Clostridia bacterium]|nr:FeoB-associated Cys-rich membrane protein [Clostridia bacterium]